MYKTAKYIFIFIIFPLAGRAQEFNYVHYDTKDGLAGSTVYDMCQDKDGFLWFATENGLSRYDGTAFKNFTVKDGLPDNEVLRLFPDSRGRLWVSTFNKDLCYLSKGKIYDKTSDSLISKMKFSGSVQRIVEMNDSTLIFSDQKVLYRVPPRQSPVKIDIDSAFHEIPFGIIIEIFRNQLQILFPDQIFFTSDDGGKSFSKGRHADPNVKIVNGKLVMAVHVNRLGQFNLYLETDGNVIGGERSNDSQWVSYFMSNDGAWEVDSVKGAWGNHYLKGKKISHTYKDYEQNIWFTTYGEGVYKLPSTDIKTVSGLFKDSITNTEAFSIAEYDHQIVAGFGLNKMVIMKNDFTESVADYGKEAQLSHNAAKNNRLYSITNLPSGELLLGFDGFLLEKSKGGNIINYSYAVKSSAPVNSQEIVVGFSWGAARMRLKDLSIIDTLWQERCTKVFFNDHHYYFGTLNGLYEVGEDGSRRFLGDSNAALTRRITDIKASADGTIWISTNDQGIVGYKKGLVIRNIRDSNGLSSNICKSIFIQDNFLWVGTDKGLNKIDISKTHFSIVKFTTSDGLPSDIINAILVKDGIVWVGSPAGLTYFNEKSISNTSSCILKMMRVRISGKDTGYASSYKLGYNNNNIRFDFVAISFKSAGEITYYYKLSGLNNQWQQTAQNSLDYQSLPPGNYQLQLYAVNKFGVKSNPILINLSVATPFWKTWWFYTLLLLAAIGITVKLANRRNKKIRSVLEERNKTQQQFAALEQQALQAQMNPHFIFNCLNSIQQYIVTNDKEKANEYLTGFASLVRQTLDNSEKKTISIAEEAKYLDQYLKMEEMRFGDNFKYSITISNSISPDFIEMPALLLQPYVENCLRHGIRYKNDGTGEVNISFDIKEGALYCVIKDNGIGRKKAAAFKSLQHIEYQSKGMSLTQKRIELLNKVNESHMKVNIIDSTDEAGNATGTEVILIIPL